MLGASKLLAIANRWMRGTVIKWLSLITGKHEGLQELHG